MPLSTLDRKLRRDLFAMKGQATAIALVVAAGVAMFVMYRANFSSLRETQHAYYRQQRFADVFASLKRAPLALTARIAQIPGVMVVETRVAAPVNLDVPGLSEPASGLLTSIDAERRPAINDLHLRSGRWIDRGRPDEILASEKFVNANRLAIGDRIGAIINGRLRQLTIVGVALSPEHVYSMPPGELIPDNRRFATLWMERQALASAFDLEGGFNDLALTLAPSASADAVIAELDRLLEPYGGRGAVPRALQPSHWTLENELSQLQSFGFALPLVFLGVAAFILNVAMTRAVALQRPQIAALKALGFPDRTIAWHYLKWALSIAGFGVGLGFVAGGWLGRLAAQLYNQFFQFPVLVYRVPVDVVVQAAAMTFAAAAIGAFSAVRGAARLAPAEAMQPEPPPRYQRSGLERPWLMRRVGNTGRMVIRNLARRPLRAAASVVGIALAAAILIVGGVFIAAMDALIANQFFVAERQDVTVTFVEPRSAAARFELARLPGVLAVEPLRVAPVRIRHGYRHRNLAIAGVSPDARLRRIVDGRGRVVPVPASGLVLSRLLAQTLQVRPGAIVDVEFLDGRRHHVRAVVAAVVDDVIGLSAYTDADTLHAMLREPRLLSGAALLVDDDEEAQVVARLKQVPAVAGASVKRAVLRNFRDTLTASLDVTITVNVIFAGLIAFGVVFNAARVSLSERSRDLASLRVLGFTRGEIGQILLGELALLTIAALPLGAVLGYAIAASVMSAMQSEVYRIPLVISPATIAWAFLTVIVAAALSGLTIRRSLARLDLIKVLKVRE